MKRPVVLALIALVLLIHLLTREDPYAESPYSTPYPLPSLRLRLPAVNVSAERPRPRHAAATVAAPKELVTVEITSYCLRGTTRLGDQVREGIIASDPRVFPLGREIDVWVGRSHYGRFYVSDTGRDIQGSRLDIWKRSCGEAILFGRRRGFAMLVSRDSA
ncbi:MAG: 3D domain-containing protein [Anaerolineae bacterium]|nr:3D domain-containing protein [Gemmatimonadaceae bacterium]